MAAIRHAPNDPRSQASAGGASSPSPSAVALSGRAFFLSIWPVELDDLESDSQSPPVILETGS